MYRFALRPRWILSHLFALVVVVGCLNLGLWQLQRHDERAERNATVEARTELPSVSVVDLLTGLGSGGGDVDSLRYRSATATGTYLDDVLLVDNRSRDGLPGAWVLSPLRLDDGSVLVVNRGFQGFEDGTIEPPPPPAGDVRVEGTLVPWDGDCGIRTDDAGDPAGMACLNREGAQQAFGSAVLPVVVQRRLSAPPAPVELTPVPLPELDAGPHRSYAAQWFIFGTIALVGYPLILRRVARDRAAEAGPERAGHDDGPGAGDAPDRSPVDAPVS